MPTRRSAGTPSLKDALRRAKRLGLEVEGNRRTGEVRVVCPGVARVNHNARRKDASRALLALIRRVEDGALLNVQQASSHLTAAIEESIG